MHNSVLSKRNHASHTRMLVTAQLLAEHLKIDPLKVEALTPKGKDKDVRLMRQREAVADLLDDIALSLGIDIPAPGKTIEEAVEDAGGDQEPEGDQEPGGDQNPEGDQEPGGDNDGQDAGEITSVSELPQPVVDEE